MNKTFTLLLCLLCMQLSTYCFSQGTTENRRPLYRALVQTVDKSIYRGVIYALNDSAVSLTSTRLAKKKQVPGEQELIAFPVSSIKQLKFEKAGATGRGFVFGSLLGILGGVVIGEATDKPCNSGSYYGCMEFVDPGAVGGILGFLGGSVIGFIVSTKKKKFEINASMQNYNVLKESIQPYLYIPNAAEQPLNAPAGK